MVDQARAGPNSTPRSGPMVPRRGPDDRTTRVSTHLSRGSIERCADCLQELVRPAVEWRRAVRGPRGSEASGPAPGSGWRGWRSGRVSAACRLAGCSCAVMAIFAKRRAAQQR